MSLATLLLAFAPAAIAARLNKPKPALVEFDASHAVLKQMARELRAANETIVGNIARIAELETERDNFARDLTTAHLQIEELRANESPDVRELRHWREQMLRGQVYAQQAQAQAQVAMAQQMQAQAFYSDRGHSHRLGNQQNAYQQALSNRQALGAQNDLRFGDFCNCVPARHDMFLGSQRRNG